MKITILTLFPEVFSQILNTSILARAQKKKLVNIALVNIRDFAKNSYKTVDDRPYGGGVGMLMKVDVLYKAIQSVKGKKSGEHIILLDAKGKRFNQKKARELSKHKHLIIICGHYEGIDARAQKYVDEVISIGDYVLTGGEIPAMAIVDAVVRLIPKVITKGATTSESFESGLLEYPQYTRPETFRGQKVPKVLLSGNHTAITKWRKSQQQKVITSSPDVSR